MTLGGQCVREDFVQALRAGGFSTADSVSRFARKVFFPAGKSERSTAAAFRMIAPGCLLALAASSYLLVRVSPIWIFAVFVLTRWMASFAASFRTELRREGVTAFLRARQHLLDPSTIQIDHEGFRVETDKRMQAIAWKHVSEMQETNDLFIITDDRRHVVLVPKRFCTDPSQVAELRDLFRSSIRQVKEST